MWRREKRITGPFSVLKGQNTQHRLRKTDGATRATRRREAMTEHVHNSVLLDEAVEALILDPEGIFVDATLGRGGHTSRILERCGSGARVFAFDRDAEAVDHGRRNFDDPRLSIIHSAFSSMQERLSESGIEAVDGVLLDLGVSSPQLDAAERGFSFLREGPLDMRMDQTSGQTAAQWLASVDEDRLAHVLREYGEERFARRLARRIVAARDEQPFVTTTQLAEFVASTLPNTERHKNPATRTFQAIRIAINGELDELESALEQAVDLLRPGGRLVVISFHSLEDRIVKRFVARNSGKHQVVDRRLPPPPDLPSPKIKSIARIKPGQSEVQANARARSAVMRVAQKVAA